MPKTSDVLHDLCAALGIDTRGLADDVLDLIALRIVVEGITPTKPNIERVIADVKRAEGSGPALPSAPSRKYRFNSTEATDARYRERLAKAHRTEDNRTGLHLVRSPEVMRPGAVHPACRAAYAEDATPCTRCIPLLHDSLCGCDVCDEWWEATE